MTRHRIADGGESIQMWRAATNVLNKLSQSTRGGPHAWELGTGLACNTELLSWPPNWTDSLDMRHYKEIRIDT